MTFTKEGLIVLHKAVMTFKDTYNKTFMRYFETILERKFINLANKKKRYVKEIELLINEGKSSPHLHRRTDISTYA